MSKQHKDDGGRDEGNPEWRNFQRLLKQTLLVPKEKLDEQRAKYEREECRRQAG